MSIWIRTWVCAAGISCFAACSLPGRASDAAFHSAESSAIDNPELRRLFDADQSDRDTEDPAGIPWEIVGPRDSARRRRVLELFSEGRILTGNDDYHAAMILQHGKSADDFLLAHELAVVAIRKGNESAPWLAAAAEDRFLLHLDRPQRFGTQFEAEEGGPWRLAPVDSALTDALRKEMNVPSLEEAKRREGNMESGQLHHDSPQR